MRDSFRRDAPSREERWSTLIHRPHSERNARQARRRGKRIPMLDEVAPKNGFLAEELLRVVAAQLHDPMIVLSLHQEGCEPCLLATLNITDDLARHVAASVGHDLEHEQEQDAIPRAWFGTASFRNSRLRIQEQSLARNTLRYRVDARRSLALSTCGPDLQRRNGGQLSARTRSCVELMLHMLWEAESSRQWGQALAAMLNAFDTAILLLEGSGHVSFLNDRARALLTRSEGIRRSGSSILACDMETSIRLQTLVQRVLDIGDGSIEPLAPNLLLLPRQGKTALVATVTRIAPGGDAAPPGIAAVCIIDPDRRSSVMAEELLRAYGLTQSESHLALQIVAGLSLTDAAARMNVSTQTARTYLKQAFWKTGTHRQADLVRCVLNGLMRIGQVA